jgi:hypothetical protein
MLRRVSNNSNSSDSDSEEENKNIIGSLSDNNNNDDDDVDDEMLIVKKNRDEYEFKLQEEGQEVEEDNEEIPAWMRYLPKTGWASKPTTASIISNVNTDDMNIMENKTNKVPISSNRFAPSSKEKQNMIIKRNNRVKNDLSKPYSSSTNSINKFTKSKVIRKSSSINETALLLSMHKIDK